MLRRGPLLLVCAALGLALGATAAVRAAAVEPFLQTTTFRMMQPPAFTVWQIQVAVRGGRSVPNVSVEYPADWAPDSTLSGAVTPDQGARFRVQVPNDAKRPLVFRVKQHGEFERVFEVDLEEAAK